MHASMHKLEEAKAHRRTIGAIKCIWTTKAAHCFPFFLGEKLALLRFRLGPSIFLKNRTILLSTYEFHQKCSPIFNTSQPQPCSHVYAVACPIWCWELYKGLFSILTPMMNQRRISPYNINASPSRKVMSIKKNIN